MTRRIFIQQIGILASILGWSGFAQTIPNAFFRQRVRSNKQTGDVGSNAICSGPIGSHPV